MDLPRFNPAKIRVASSNSAPPVTNEQTAVDRMREGLARNWRIGGLPAVLGITQPKTVAYKKLDGTTQTMDLKKIADASRRITDRTSWARK